MPRRRRVQAAELWVVRGYQTATLARTLAIHMAILINKDTKVICQGITGSFGAVHTKGCYEY